MSARIARGSGSSARSKKVSKGGARSARRAPEPSLIETLPIAPHTLHRIGWWLALGIISVIALATLFAMGIPRQLGLATGEAIGRAGFAVRRVEVKGLDRMNAMQVHWVALSQESMAMPLVDLDGTRDKLMRFGWIKDARVSRRLPDTLVVDIIERRPAAIWQNAGQLSLIDPDGVVLEPVELDSMPDLPLVIGPGANHHIVALDRLVAAAPSLRPMVAGATWIGGRRWDLRFQSGEVLALPEGELAARQALERFVRMDQSAQLLGRGFQRFDMRIEGKLVTDLSREPGATVPQLAPAAPPPSATPVDPATTI